MKKIILSIALLQLVSCAELQQVVNQLPQATKGVGLTTADMGNGLRQALDLGIQKQVSSLTKKDGFYKNELVKIALPQELHKVDKALRDIGLGNLADKGIMSLNRAAESAVEQATPIFVSAVKDITFEDAKAILLGQNNAATTYLEQKTNTALYQKFEPVIKESFARVGADKIWTDLIGRYNTIPFVAKVNPDLTDYVTTKALDGVYTMIAQEENQIRTKTTSRTTALLQKVFALQDNK